MSTIDAPVATIASTMLCLTMSTYTCIQPAALVLPAKVNIIVQSLSLTIMFKISVALAISREVKDISLKELIIGVESNDLMSICLIVSFIRSFFCSFSIFFTFNIQLSVVRFQRELAVIRFSSLVFRMKTEKQKPNNLFLTTET